jgi:hypothetical protein
VIADRGDENTSINFGTEDEKQRDLLFGELRDLLRRSIIERENRL